MKKCSKCGALIAHDGAPYCPNKCGAPFLPANLTYIVSVSVRHVGTPPHGATSFEKEVKNAAQVSPILAFFAEEVKIKIAEWDEDEKARDEARKEV